MLLIPQQIQRKYGPQILMILALSAIPVRVSTVSATISNRVHAVITKKESH